MSSRRPGARQTGATRQPAGSRKPADPRATARSRTASATGQRTVGVRSRPAKVRDRRVARSRRRILRRALAGFAGIAALAAVGALVWLVGWSDVLALEEVHVTGADDTVEARVVALAAPPIGEPLVTIDTDAMAQAVREMPEVADVSVTRSWPRALTISVQPRTPEAAISDGSSWWQVDADGVLFGNDAEQPDGLPVLAAPTGDTVEDVAARAAGVAVLTGLPGELADQVVTVTAETEASVQLTLDSGATVTWGTADQMDDKSEVLLALLAEEATHYDVSAPAKPAIRP
ncbi:MAG TPA: FtsQ-type POTRA domain-containing protein [Jiangellales bacterium]|nr:FtsQ-type POTRA domain-containing protein [Jiangellales bacterium]